MRLGLRRGAATVQGCILLAPTFLMNVAAEKVSIRYNLLEEISRLGA